MAIATIEGGRVPIRLWTQLETVEEVALAQLRNIAKLPWVFSHVAVMPDVHFGKGATVGSVIAMRGAVSPAAVGVDIGCGMAAVRTTLTAKDLPDSLEPLYDRLLGAIPVGFRSHERGEVYKADNWPGWKAFSRLDPKVQDLLERARSQLGTLGGGNHFIEICLDTKQRVWIMLHSGSRNIGKVLAEIHIARAKTLAHNADLPDPDLAVFLAGTPEMEAYRHDVSWAQEYAKANRELMLFTVKDHLRAMFPQTRFAEPISCHHNYVAKEVHFGVDCIVTRKGAIRARMGDMGIIPGSMGAKSYIVRGLGNPNAFESASHGAGRRMSRAKALKTFTVADLAEQTAGVCCAKDESVLDEAPGSYKDIETVMANQHDLVEIVHELKQVLCVKGPKDERRGRRRAAAA